MKEIELLHVSLASKNRWLDVGGAAGRSVNGRLKLSEDLEDEEVDLI